AAEMCEGLLRAAYPTNWVDGARPVYDRLRQMRRDALVARLVGNQDYEDEKELRDTLLIDISMEPRMTTSRVVQAYIAVQRYVHRCLRGREPNVNVDLETDPDWEQWQELQHYRLHEASRRIFLTPEVWLQPELRDDKTPFFRELE